MAENKLKSLQGLPKLGKSGTSGLPKLGSLKKTQPKGDVKSEEENKSSVKNESVDVKAEAAEVKAEAAEVKAEAAEVKAEAAEVKAEAAEVKAEAAEVKTEAAEVKTEAAEDKSDNADNKNDEKAASSNDNSKSDNLSELDDSASIDMMANDLLSTVGGMDNWDIPGNGTSMSNAATVADALSSISNIKPVSKDAKSDADKAKSNNIPSIKPISKAGAAEKSGQNAKVTIAPLGIKVPPKSAPQPEPEKKEESTIESTLSEQTDLGSSLMPIVDPMTASEVLATSEPLPEIDASKADSSKLPGSLLSKRTKPIATAPVNDKPESESAPQRELTEEEQFEALLAQMSPEERAEYEAHLREQERAAYAPKKKPIGLIVGIVVVLLAIGGGLALFLGGGEEEPEPEPIVIEEPPEPAEPVIQRVELEQYDVSIDAGEAAFIYINGVETPVSGPFKFVSGHANTVIAFSEGMLPYFQTFEEKPEEAIKLEFEPDSYYSKGSISFRFANKQIMNDASVKFDGVEVTNLKDAIEDVVLGRPHVLTIEHPDYAKYMSIIIPDDLETKLSIPELETEENAKFGTKCNLKKLDNKHRVDIKTSSEKFNSFAEVLTAPGDIIEYSVKRDQRFPIIMSVIPDGYGLLNFQASLLHDSVGKAVLQFNLPKKSTIEVCMRRVGEVICPDMKGETEVPSSPSWEFFGTELRNGERKIMLGTQTEEIQSTYKYVYDVSQDKRGGLQLKFKAKTKLKKKAE